MGLLGNLRGRQALVEHQRGNYEKAEALYAQALEKGVNTPAMYIGYAVLLLRSGKYEPAVEMLRKAEKAPGVTKEQKVQIVLHYAVGIYKLGRLERSLELLRELFRNNKTGMMYDTLGYLLVEAGNFEEALAFNQEAADYDEDDAVALDNLAQTYYRLGSDPAAARPWFEKALAQKPSQIDTLYFLAHYDIEEGKYDAAREKLETALSGRFSPLNYADKEKIEALLKTLPEAP